MYNYLQPHTVIMKMLFVTSSDDLKVSVLYFMGTQGLDPQCPLH